MWSGGAKRGTVPAALRLPEWFGDDGPAVAQLIHDSLAGVIAKNPKRFRGLCTLPLQNVLVVLVFVLVISGVVLSVGALTNIPFGPFVFTDDSGERVFNVLPWPMPLVWTALPLASTKIGFVWAAAKTRSATQHDCFGV